MKHYKRYSKSEAFSRGLYLFPLACLVSFFMFEINFYYLERTSYKYQEADLFQNSVFIKSEKSGKKKKMANSVISQDLDTLSSDSLVKDFIVGGGSATSISIKNKIVYMDRPKQYLTNVVNKNNQFSKTFDRTSAKYNTANPGYPGKSRTTTISSEASVLKSTKHNSVTGPLKLHDSIKENMHVSPTIQKTLEENQNNNPNAFDIPGEYGRPVFINQSQLSPEDEIIYKNGWKKFAFNEYVSRIISVRRKLMDPRDPACKYLKYSENLPDASVVLTFHNEAWSVLLRSVYSIIDRSPDHLLKEIILVDDFSNMDHLKSPLDEYMAQFRKVRIVRAKHREGLIRARLLGFRVATADVVIFLDSHIECTVGWLEPLLDRIALSQTTVVAPAIDIIKDDSFAHLYQSAKGTNIGGFDWSLTFKWQIVGKEERFRRQYMDHLPIRSPTMAGGLFAINRKYFEYLGTYDEGMEFWGGENLELSFRIWMCGGILETVPCSHVGHVFRKQSPYKWKDEQTVVKRNNLRLAEVWLDDFKFYYYQNIDFKLVDFGDISSRKAIRNRLQCNNFNWYLTHIYPDAHIPGESLNSGEIRSKVKGVCLDGPYLYGKVDKLLIVFNCHGKEGPQYWLYTRKLEIRHDYGCFDFDGKILQVAGCHGQGGNQKWMYKDNQYLYHISTDMCIELSAEGQSVSMNKCKNIDRQIWLWKAAPPLGPTRAWQLRQK